MKHKKKMETSKVIILIVGVVAIITWAVGLWIAATKDTSIMQWLITATAAEAATGTGFYYSKARAENEIKLSRARREEEQDADT